LLLLAACGLSPATAAQILRSEATTINSDGKMEITSLDHNLQADEKKANSASDEQVLSMMTNGGLFTLQAIPRGGLPMTCSIPECSRSDDCKDSECCSTQMFNALVAITDWMKSNDVKYSVLFGTLLGAHRDQDIIPWTGDLDIGIYSKDVAKLMKQTDIAWKFAFEDSFVIPRGCENHKPDQTSGFPGKYSTFTMGHLGYCNPSDVTSALSCSYYIDLYVLDEPDHGGGIAANCIRDSLDTNGNLNTAEVTIRGRTFDGPSKVEACLKAEYGSDWKTPDQKKSYHGR